jgi:hypothetical protein
MNTRKPTVLGTYYRNHSCCDPMEEKKEKKMKKK